ncbi:hypothetical protein ACOMHN_024550 [Nucella lapillus]
MIDMLLAVFESQEDMDRKSDQVVFQRPYYRELVEGGRRRGRQKKKPIDRQCGGVDRKTFRGTQTLAHDRDRWTRLMRILSRRRPNDSIRR